MAGNQDTEANSSAGADSKWGLSQVLRFQTFVATFVANFVEDLRFAGSQQASLTEPLNRFACIRTARGLPPLSSP
jgi:hypothetical protein